MKKIFLLLVLVTLARYLAAQQTDSLQAARMVDSLLTAANNLRKAGKSDEALLLVQQGAEISEKKWGTENGQYAATRQALANLHADLGQYEQAEALYLKAIEIRSKVFGTEDPNYANSLYSLGTLYLNQRNLAKAEPLLVSARDIRGKVLGKEHADYARSLNNLAVLYQYQGEYEKSAQMLLEVVEIRRKVYGKESREYASALTNLANAYNSMGDYDQSEPYDLEAKSIREKVLGKDHPDYAMSLENLAITYSTQGKYEKAEAYFLEAKQVFGNSLGREHNSYAASLNGLGDLYYRMGNFEKAESCLLEAVAIREKKVGKDHPDYAASLLDLTRLYIAMGNYDAAKRLSEEALAVFERTQNEKSQTYANGLQYAGRLAWFEGDPSRAEAYFLKSKAIIEKMVGKEHPDYAASLNNLGYLYLLTENYEKAEPLYLEAIAVQEKVFGKDHPSYAVSLSNLATVYRNEGKYKQAESLLQEALAIREKSLGKENTDYSGNLLELGNLYWSSGELDKVCPLLTASAAIDTKSLSEAAQYLSEQELMAYTATFTDRLNSDLSFAQTQSCLAGTCFDEILFYKGFLQHAVLQINKLAQSDSATLEKYNLLKSYRRRLADEYSEVIADRKHVPELETAANTLEKELARSIAGLSDALRQATWQEVQQKLKPEEAAVEFIQYRFSHPKQTDSIFYGALVLRPGDPRAALIPLFEEKELATLLRGGFGGNNFLKINALYASKKDNSGQRSLYELIWQPLENRLKGATTIYCSPAGLLHRINLAAIPDAAGGVFGESRQVVCLGSTRQLVVHYSGHSNSGKGAYLAGGIRYDSDSTEMAVAIRGITSRSAGLASVPVFHQDSASITRGGVLDYLPATAAEAREIGQILSAANISAKIDTGFNATEEAFRQLGNGSPSPRMIHLATHGYFFPDPVKKVQNAAGNFGQEPVFKESEHPMIRSGLIMAGAKQAWLTGRHPQNQEDGILTAYEISQMNLSGTELVVLSACETGLGDIVGNEGVYGLQRAFKIAGVKYLIMSLWKVDDRSTREFMTTFYRHWLTGKQTIPQAFRLTQQEMRHKYPGAYDWAGFVLIE